MQNTIYLKFLIVLIIFSSCRSWENQLSRNEQNFTTIDSFIEQKDFFAAREYYKNLKLNLSSQNKLLAEIFLENAFNQPASSNKKIEILLNEGSTQGLSDSLILRIKTTELDNSIKLYDYRRAKQITEDLIGNYAHLLGEEKIKDHENTLIIWTALKDQQKQEVIIKKNIELELIKDKAGLQTLPVNKDSVTEQFVFDSGANFSTITKSIAKLFDLQILDGKFEVNSITGSKIESQIAIAPQLFLGDIEIKNVVFLVFPDEALEFAQINYQINGIIGFPVIEALKEIQITKDGIFLVPLTRSKSQARNLAIDFLTPLVFIEDNRGSGTYTFDTGADKTMLYKTYYDKFLSSTKDTLKSIDYSFGGAGGNTSKKGSYISFNLHIGNSNVVLDSVMVLREEINPDNEYLGNIGQDIIKKFDKMTINFEEMFLRFD